LDQVGGDSSSDEAEENVGEGSLSLARGALLDLVVVAPKDTLEHDIPPPGPEGYPQHGIRPQNLDV